jgi:hypothetical protein
LSNQSAEIIDIVRSHGSRLWRQGKALAVSHCEQLPPELVARLRQHKHTILAYLDDMGLPSHALPWVHVARQVNAGEFDGGTRSELESVLIGIRGSHHPAAVQAVERLHRLLGREAKG